jgi:hypothetical protein
LEQGRQLGRTGIEVNAILGVNAVYVPTISIILRIERYLVYAPCPKAPYHNIRQNKPNFKLKSLEEQPPLFKFKRASKTLNPPKDDLEDINNYRTVTIKCLVFGCK